MFRGYDRIAPSWWVVVVLLMALAEPGCGSSAGSDVEPSVPAGDGEAPEKDDGMTAAIGDDGDPDAFEATEEEPAQTPPKPQKAENAGPPAELTFTYQRRKITACGMVDDEQGKRCDATSFADEQAPAEVTLTPIDEQEDVDPSRDEQVLSFAAQAGVQNQVANLKKGRWELVWKGAATARDRFYVVAKDRFDVALEEFVGACSSESGKCKLEPSKLQQSIELPEKRVVH